MAETGTNADRAGAADARAERLYTIIRDLAIELEPSRRETLAVTADSILDRDLGIDSLARPELSLRIERGFGVRLAEQALMEATTPADLLSALEAAHSEEAAAMLRPGNILVYYPEGAFDRMPGLRAFHMEAFVAAAEAGVPVIPAIIHGTRSILRAFSSFPRRGCVTAAFGPSIQPEGTGWDAAVRLRRQSREAILENCGEPDLAYEPKPF